MIRTSFEVHAWFGPDGRHTIERTDSATDALELARADRWAGATKVDVRTVRPLSKSMGDWLASHPSEGD